jgi:hypothetical protein
MLRRFRRFEVPERVRHTAIKAGKNKIGTIVVSSKYLQ